MALASGNVRLTITRALRLNYTRRLKKNRLLDFPFYHTLILLEEKKWQNLSLLFIPLKLFQLEFHFLKWASSHSEGKNMSLHFESDSYLVFDANFCPKDWSRFHLFSDRAPSPWTPPPGVTCVWLNSLRSTELSKWRSDYGGVRVNTAVHKRVIIGAHRGVIMRAVSAAPPRVKGARKRLWCCLYFHLKN